MPKIIKSSLFICRLYVKISIPYSTAMVFGPRCANFWCKDRGSAVTRSLCTYYSDKYINSVSRTARSFALFTRRPMFVFYV